MASPFDIPLAQLRPRRPRTSPHLTAPPPIRLNLATSPAILDEVLDCAVRVVGEA
jgi:hypothetical protein